MRARHIWLPLVCLLLTAPAAATADTGPALSIDAGSGRHAISPLIYGWNYADPGFAAEIDLPVDRRGGNAADTLNWQTGVENHSSDYFFENLPTCWSSCPDGWGPARSYTDQIDADRTAGAKSLLDVPMLGIVPLDFPGDNNAVHCSYSVAKYGDQTEVDPYDTDCGSGFDAVTQDPIVNDPTDTGQTDTPADEAAWVSWLVGNYGDASSGGVAFYELGNEPGLWNSTHRDWHPNAVTATELMNDSQALALAIKGADPTAQTIGPAEWGWPNYFCSAADGGCGPSGPDPVAGTDFQKYGPMMEAYLKNFADYDAKNGQRLLDYLDLHYYAQGGNTTDITRSLWDPTYHDPSWIDKVWGVPIDLIPRMRQWVADDYPGTKMSLSEYDLANGGDSTTNNLIEADVLGIFAREQMDMATLWPETTNDNYYDAFRIFRNYDGAHSKFGDTYVSSTSGDQSQLAVYGGLRSGDGNLTLVVINKSGADLTSPVSLAGFTAGESAQVWRWAGVGGGIVRQPDQAVCNGGIQATFPARTITMLVLAPGDGGCAPPATTAPAGPAPGGGSPQPPAATPPPTTATAVVHCVVPRLIGSTLKAAKGKLTRAHCRLGKVANAKSKRKRGTVIAQKPNPRRILPRGARVGVTLSRGR